MFAVIRDPVSNPQILKDPFNPTQMLVMRDIKQLRETLAELQIKDYLICVVDPIYRNTMLFEDLTKNVGFAQAFKREGKYQAAAFVRDTGPRD